MNKKTIFCFKPYNQTILVDNIEAINAQYRDHARKILANNGICNAQHKYYRTLSDGYLYVIKDKYISLYTPEEFKKTLEANEYTIIDITSNIYTDSFDLDHYKETHFVNIF